MCAVDLTPEVRELRYSVKQSRRDNGACPGEIVALSCLVYGDRLFWEISWRDAQSEERTFPIGGFTDSNTTMQGNGFWRQVLIRESRFNFSGVLDFISSTDDGCLPLCQSTIAVIPDNNDSNIEFNIICNTEASTGNSERVSKTQVHTISTEMACIGIWYYSLIVLYIIANVHAYITKCTLSGTGIETPTCPNSGM